MRECGHAQATPDGRGAVRHRAGVAFAPAAEGWTSPRVRRRLTPPVLPGGSPMRAAMFVLTAGLPLLSTNTRAADPPTGREYTGRTQAIATVAVRPRVTGELTRL